MQIQSVRVKNFRSIKEESLACDDITALVGPNGAGKSSFLRAMELFYAPTVKVDVGDFYANDDSKPIEIELTFKVASAAAKELFSGYLQGETLSVVRVIASSSGKVSAKYHGSSLQSPSFAAIRAAEGAKEKRRLYEELQEQADFKELPAWRKEADALQVLQQWESTHPDKCARQRDDGQFFGFSEVGKGYLGRFTRFLLIPAVRDAAEDAADGRGSIFSTLMDLVVRSALANKESLKKLRDETQQKYQELVNPENLPELGDLGTRISKTLKTFVPDAAVNLHWQPLGDVSIPLPQADIKLVEDGFESAVRRVGHGLQRAFALSLIQHLALAQTRGKEKQEVGAEGTVKPEENQLPSFALAIEEPELYQHPDRQRHFARVLRDLAKGEIPGVATHTQVLYATHSPLFVGIDRLQNIRLVRKIASEPGKPRVSKVISTTLEAVAEKLWQANGATGAKFSESTLIARLHAIMTPWMNEGFFAEVAILVEGEDDRAALLGAAMARDLDLESEGFAIIPTSSKANMDRPAIIFAEFGIPVYCLWDGDGGRGETAGTCPTCERPLDQRPSPSENHRLLRIVGEEVVDWPCLIGSKGACFQRDLEHTLAEELGDGYFEAKLAEKRNEFGIMKRKHALKNPVVLSSVLRDAQKDGRTCSTLEAVLTAARALKAAK